MTSFEQTKGEIAASALGRALGLAASWTWAQIVAKLKEVVNRGTLNWSASNTTYSVPAGYYAGGTLDSRVSYNAGMAAGIASGKTSYSIVPYSNKTSGTLVNSYSLTVPSGKTKAIVIASAHIINHNLNNGIICTGGTTIAEKTVYKKDESYDYCSYYRECTVSPGNILTITASNTGSTHSIHSSGCVIFI